MAQYGFVASYDGNVSLRGEDGIYITATRTLKAEAGIDDVCLLAPDGKFLEGSRKPSTESEMHLFIYRERPDVKGIVHAHPPYSTAFAAARKPLDMPVFPEVVLDIGAVPLAEYATPATAEVARSLTPFVKSANAILLANHGVVCVAENIDEAFYRMEKLELAARTIAIAQTLGGAVPLTASQLDYLYETHQDFQRRDGFTKASMMDCDSCDEKHRLDFIRQTALRVLRQL